MKKRIIALAVAGILAVSAVTGCSSGTKAASGNMREHNDLVTADENYTVNSKSGSANNYTFDLADYDYEEYYEAESGAVVRAPEPGGDVNVDPSKGRLLIRTVSIVAETTKYAEVAASLESQVKACGGYIEYSSMNGTGNNKDLRTGTYTVRVPADKLDGLVSSVGSSCTVTSSNENTSDVTLEYVDTKAKVDSLRVEYDQLMTLLSQATDLDTIIVLQNRLTDVRYQIESAESRIRVLENQVQYATLSLTLREVLEEKEVEEAHVITYGERVRDQFKDMWENTVDFFEDLLLGIIAIIPGIIFLSVITVIVLFIVFSARKKRRARRAKALAAKEAAEKKEKEKISSDNKNTKEDKSEDKKDSEKA